MTDTQNLDIEFEFEDATWDDVESTRKRKTVERDSATHVKTWLTKFSESGRDIGGRFPWTKLPATVQTAFSPRPSETGNRTLGGMAAIVRKVKEYQDTLDVYPVPMDDPAIHAINVEMGEDIAPEDARYGGFILVRKSAWTAHKNPKSAKAEAPAEAEDVAPEETPEDSE